MSVRTKKIAMMGMLLAAQVVAGMFFSIKLPLVTIGFIFLPLSLTGMLYGPLWGGAAGVMGDFLIAALGPYGYYPPTATTAWQRFSQHRAAARSMSSSEGSGRMPL